MRAAQSVHPRATSGLRMDFETRVVHSRSRAGKQHAKKHRTVKNTYKCPSLCVCYSKSGQEDCYLDSSVMKQRYDHQLSAFFLQS